MAVSLKKSTKVDLSKSEPPQKMREYTPVHLTDEEESIQKSRGQAEPLTDENNYPAETPIRKLRLFAENIIYNVANIIPLIVLIVTFVMILLLIPILNDMMDKIAFDLSAVEASAEIISIGAAENKELQGVTVTFTDIYGNEQTAKILLDKGERVKIGDVISIRYDPDDTKRISVEEPLIDIA